MEKELTEKSEAHLILKGKAQISSTMENREEHVDPWASLFENFCRRPRSSATSPKVKISKLENVYRKTIRSSATTPKVKSKVQKKVTNKNPERVLRLKRSTIDFKSLAFEQAKEVQANLSNQFPSIIKYMLPSHVSRGFWLAFPRYFCVMHMPKFDTIFVLEDENGREYKTKFLAESTGLSGGWRGFSIAHKLVEGDVLVFHLIQSYKFKVYIIRSHGSNEMGVVPSPQHLDGRLKSHDSNVRHESNLINNTIILCDAHTQPSDQTFLNVPPAENYPSSDAMIIDAHILPSDQHENIGNVGSHVLNEMRLSEYSTTFKQVTSIENFSIMTVNGSVLGLDLSRHLKAKYYELCCSQGMFLHENLIEGEDGEHVLAMICETINIADEIRGCKITTPSDKFAAWHKSLKGLEVLGMNVSFLLARLGQLMSLESKAKSTLNSYMKLKYELEQAVKEKKVFEPKLQEVKRTISKLDGELDSQNQELKSLEAEYDD